MTENSLRFDSLKIDSETLNRKVLCDFYLVNEQPNQNFKLLLLNDGQDAVQLNLKKHLKKLKLAANESLLVVGIHAGNRMQEYGVASRPDFAKRGALASDYTMFLIFDLLPLIEDMFPISKVEKDRTIAGFSLGGLSAFDIGLQYPNQFSKIGVFSGSFWWRKKALDKGYKEEKDRIAIEVVKNLTQKSDQRFWLQAGTADELSDRNNNGIIDAIDDTLDVITALAQKGYRPYDEITYVEVKDGEHNFKTWSAVFPQFLEWVLRY